MGERRFDTLMVVTLLHAAGCAQLATSLDRRATRTDATAESVWAPLDVVDATAREAEVVEADIVDAVGDGLDTGELPEAADGGLDVDVLLDADAGFPSDPDADSPADAPCEGGFDRCGTRVCAPVPCELRPPRPLAPIAALRLHTARPWFRWELPTGADGARLEVCASPRCDRVEHTWIVDGSRFRPPVALGQGVHFWRLTAHRGGLLAAVVGPTWMFGIDLTLPTPEAQMARRDALLDVNGDGVEEQVADPTMPPPDYSWAFDLILSGTSPPVHQRVAGRPGHYHTYPGTNPNGLTLSLAGVFPVGDVNGDGFGDFATGESGQYSRGGSSLVVDLYLGGRDGAREGPQQMESPTSNPVGVVAITVGDVNGDGYGDALLNWHGDLGWGQLLVGGPDRRVLRDACFLLTGWIGHGDVDADGYEDVMTRSVTRGTWADAFAFFPGGPDAGRSVRCGLVSRSAGSPTPISLPLGVRAHVFDENDDGYDDVVIDDDWTLERAYQIFRGGLTGIPFTDRGPGP